MVNSCLAQFERRRRKTRLKHSDKTSIQVFITTFTVISVLFCLLPLCMTIINSTKTNYEIRSNIFALPSGFVYANYREAFSVLGLSMFNSILVAFVGSAVRMLFAAVLAYIFAQKDFMGKEFFFYLYLVMLFVPSTLGTSVLYAFMYKVNLIDTYWAVWLPYVAGGQAGATFLFRTFFRQQPKSVIEAARIDGANDVHIFFMLVIPLAIPILLYGFLQGFGSYYNDYLWPSLVLKSEHNITLMVTLIRASSIYEAKDWGVVYAMYLVSSIPLIITSAISLKFFQSGEFASGMKL